MAAFPEYLYIVVLAIFFGFWMAFGIGANDVANAFGSSVSAGSLSLGWAIILGTVMEFAGSMLIGASVTNTIRNKIVDPKYYKSEPEVLMFGMCCALIVGSIWLLIATSMQLAVSTTHDIIAALIGFSIAAHGFETVDWKQTSLIFVSWFTSPLFACLISSIFFKTLLETVLKSEHVFDRAFNVFPVVVFIGVTVNIFFILEKGRNNKRLDIPNFKTTVVLPCSLGSGVVCALLTYFVIGPFLRNRVTNLHDEHMANENAAKKEAEIEVEENDETGEQNAKKLDDDDDVDKPVVEQGVRVPEPVAPPAKKTYSFSPSGAFNLFADNTWRQDLKTESFNESKRAEAIWEKQDHYDPKAERLFSYLQVFTACMASFSHGGNDVANAIAPVSGVLSIYQNGKIASKSGVQRWLLAMGGAGISLGFLFYGYKIVKAVGYKLTAISPSRGFCIELAAALAVSLASYLQMPVSTTQCLVGATCGVGLASAGLRGVEWFFLLKTMSAWVCMFFVVAVVSAGFFSFSAYSPKIE